MRIVIFGATGGIGRHALQHALAKGYEVVAYARNPNKIKTKHPRLAITKGELTDYEAMRDAIRGCDAVVWTVGVSMKRHYEGMPALDGHKLLLKAMKETGVKRLVDWGTPSVKFGQDKQSFIPAGAEAFKRDVPAAEVHFVSSGHFALESHHTEIAALMREFLGRVL